MVEENIFGLRFHHFGLAVRQPEKALSFLSNLNYTIGERTYDSLQVVNLMICTNKVMPDVELIYPAESPGPLESLLKNHSEIIYHLCYSCNDIDLTLKELRTKHRVITISEPKPAILFGHKRVAFYQVQGFGMIELLEDAI